MPRRTIGATKKCAEWLATCLDLGWSRSSLDQLEWIWWKYHDRFGNLRKTRLTTASKRQMALRALVKRHMTKTEPK